MLSEDSQKLQETGFLDNKFLIRLSLEVSLDEEVALFKINIVRRTTH